MDSGQRTAGRGEVDILFISQIERILGGRCQLTRPELNVPDHASLRLCIPRIMEVDGLFSKDQAIFCRANHRAIDYPEHFFRIWNSTCL